MNPHIFVSTIPDPAGQILRTRMLRFTSLTGVHGLARDNSAGTLEVLAVAATTKRKGQFREFIKLCQQHYQTVVVWHIDNPIVSDAGQAQGDEAFSTVTETKTKTER